MPSNYHVKYFAEMLRLRQSADGGVGSLSASLFNAGVDLNPHQIEAALFAVRSPLAKGVLLADEVGLGKTIEAGIVLCQYWAERRRRLVVICPASLRKQWATELAEKFGLPSLILDAKTYRDRQRAGASNPFAHDAGIVITSMHYAARQRSDLALVPWDLVVIDEAHKLRNAHQPNNRVGRAIREATIDRRKILLTATPLQNSLMELYGLSTLIDDQLFGDPAAFRAQFMSRDADTDALVAHLRAWSHRTLRRDVGEYVKYTDRKLHTEKFQPADEEHALYEAISAFLRRDGTYAIPARQRELTTMVLRKLLASSSSAVAGTLEHVRDRLVRMKQPAAPATPDAATLVEQLIDEEDIDTDELDEATDDRVDVPEPTPEAAKLDAEIAELNGFIARARSVRVDEKTRALLAALRIGFDRMAAVGGARKAVIFTESRRTQDYLRAFLEANGYAGKIVLFNGTNGGPDAEQIFQDWMRVNAPLGRASGSPSADRRQALIEHFRDDAEILLATESAAEGVNLQFCSLVLNYDLPWNPQRIEQRIGRCHRYGQRHDVVVVNFLNERNQADARVLELLDQKLNLFQGVFGASDAVLGTIEGGVDFERRVHAIYQTCRTPAEIDLAFAELRREMESSINARMTETRRKLLEHFDADVHDRLRLRDEETRRSLGRIERQFWALTKHVLADRATFDDEAATFALRDAVEGSPAGRYRLISRNGEKIADATGAFVYRLSHPLGEHCIATASAAPTPVASLTFRLTGHPTRLAGLEPLRGMSGTLVLTKLTIDSAARDEHLLFNAILDDGRVLDSEQCERLFDLRVDVAAATIAPETLAALDADADRHVQATLARAAEKSNVLYREQVEHLHKWAEGQTAALDEELRLVKARINALSRDARQATSVADQKALQEKISEEERAKRRLRAQIDDREDEIKAKRDGLIDALDARLTQTMMRETLFVIHWNVV